MLADWLAKIASRFERRIIYDRDGKSPYLSRFYLLFRDRGGEATWQDGDRFPLNIFLHHFHRGDDDEALHNHPWRWSVSIILAGGYVEERRVRSWATNLSPQMSATIAMITGLLVPFDEVVKRTFKPGSINVIRANDYHRVDLLDEKHGAWSLFIAGPRTGKSWGFWDRASGVFTPWREFIARKRGVETQHVAR